MLLIVERKFELNIFFHVLVPPLLQYNYWKTLLDNPENQNNEKLKRTGHLMLDKWGQAICILVEDLHEEKEFLAKLEDYCTTYKYPFNPTKVLSDVLSERHKAEHPEIN